MIAPSQVFIGLFAALLCTYIKCHVRPCKSRANNQYSKHGIAGSAPLFKRFMNLKFVQISLALLLAGYMGLVRRTTRWQIEGADILKPLQDSGEGFVACAWHGRFLMTTAGWPKMQQKPHILISKSRDGNLVSYTSKFLRAGVIRGSRRAKFKDKNKRGAGRIARDDRHTQKRGRYIYDAGRAQRPSNAHGPRAATAGQIIRRACARLRPEHYKA